MEKKTLWCSKLENNMTLGYFHILTLILVNIWGDVFLFSPLPQGIQLIKLPLISFSFLCCCLVTREIWGLPLQLQVLFIAFSFSRYHRVPGNPLWSLNRSHILNTEATECPTAASFHRNIISSLFLGTYVYQVLWELVKFTKFQLYSSMRIQQVLPE